MNADNRFSDISKYQTDSEKNRTYISIDLKSFYASVEAAERKLDPMTTNLVVADESRTEKTICLAVSPSLKSLGIPGRARLYEVNRIVQSVNDARMKEAVRLGAVKAGEDGQYCFSGASADANALNADPSLSLSFIIAPPRMLLYETVSTQIFSIYSSYVSPEDIHVYSIDECFLDVTSYLKTYGMSARDLAVTMIRDVLKKTGITAAAGIGTNLFLAKVAMDIVAKHVPADDQGVRIAELNERTYRELLWCHRPLTDFWRVGAGTAKRVSELGCGTMGDIARLSLKNEKALYDVLGVNAELLIDHAWGWEPARISDIKSYRPESTSISSGQVLMEPYDCEKGKLIVQEMTELLALDLVRKGVVTQKVELTIGYDRQSLDEAYRGKNMKDSIFIVSKTGKRYRGTVTKDAYGRVTPKPAHGTGNIDRWTNSAKRIMDTMTGLYDRIIDPDLLIRRVNMTAVNIVPENEIPADPPEQIDMFTDYTERESAKELEKEADARERKLQNATLALQEKYGKNAVLKGMNLRKGGTTRQRNMLIGGHNAGKEESSAVNTSAEMKSYDAVSKLYNSGTGITPEPASCIQAKSLEGETAETVYADLIDLPYRQSTKMPHMSLYKRAAQFAPFAALSGYGDMIKEEARETHIKTEIGEDSALILDQKLRRIRQAVQDYEYPLITFTVFAPDGRKAGGEYYEVSGKVKKIDMLSRVIMLENQDNAVDIDCISSAHGKLVDDIDNRIV